MVVTWPARVMAMVACDEATFQDNAADGEDDSCYRF